MEYRHKTSPSPRKFKVVASARKVLFTVFWDMEGMVHMEFLEQGQTERYISTLRVLKLRLRRVRRDKDSILQHDNARPHTSRQTQDALRQLELTTLPHPAYSPDLAPSDYYLFPQLKKYLKAITMTMMRKLSQMFASGAVDSRLNSSLTACAN
ncbi:histone-lysine N-methyltransferase SETMAR [Plakobranchus ocellatus]|uniref:Histone-lysine N-methyltransferase SETMAR n=1 Tax=Plakobranchus ocellatus TaxID=259542 RepID=A0AAV3YIN7_9GAST|nr:histone-lysine N-methyltransferase SETMAR [Plakobranchus ocellatus]